MTLSRNRNGRITRRAYLAGAATVSAGAALLTACGTPAAAPVSRAAPIILQWRPDANFPPNTEGAIQEALAPWLRKNRGVQITISSTGFQQTMIASLLAGSGPDIIGDWVWGSYLTAGGKGGLLLDIAPYIKRDNLNLSRLYSGGQLHGLQALSALRQSGSLYFLPATLHTEVMAVNEDVLDQMGLSYPSPDWTFNEWTALWRATTIKSTDPKKARIGGAIRLGDWPAGFILAAPCAFYLKGFGGEYVDPKDATRCYLNSPGSLKALEWLVPLLREGVINSANRLSPQQVSVPAGTTGYPMGQYWGSLRNIKWRFYPMPSFPKGRVTFSTLDAYAIWAGTKRPDVAWSFFKYLTVQPEWARQWVRMSAQGPTLRSLWQEYPKVLEAIIPNLKGRGLHYFTEAVLANEPYIGRAFKYTEGSAVTGVLTAWWASLMQGKATAAGSVGPVAHRVDAMETAAQQKA